jgi:O-antigen ligase
MLFKLILGLFLYLPFQVALNPTTGVDLASIRVLILLFFFFWLAFGLKNKKLLIKNNLQTIFITAFLFFNLLSTVVARNSDWSIRKIAYLLSIFPIYFVFTSIINSEKRLLQASKFLLLSGAGVAMLGIAQFLLQFIIGLEKTYSLWAILVQPFLGKSFGASVLMNQSWLVNIAGKTYLRATATFPDPHMFSFYLGMLIPLALGMFLYEKKQKNIWLTVLIILFIANLLTFSRGAYLGLLAGVITFGIFSWKKLDRRYKLTSFFLASLFLVFLIWPNPIAQRFFSSFNLKEGSNSGRMEMWQKASEGIMENPALGVGIGNFPLFVKPTATYREPIYAHNTYLDIAVETGVVNALIWIGLLGVAFFEFYKKGQQNIVFLSLAISLVIFATHSFVDMAIYSPVVLTLFLAIISFSSIQPANEDRD